MNYGAIFFATLAIALSGCGGGSDDSGNSVSGTNSGTTSGSGSSSSTTPSLSRTVAETKLPAPTGDTLSINGAYSRDSSQDASYIIINTRHQKDIASTVSVPYYWNTASNTLNRLPAFSGPISNISDISVYNESTALEISSDGNVILMRGFVTNAIGVNQDRYYLTNRTTGAITDLSLVTNADSPTTGAYAVNLSPDGKSLIYSISPSSSTTNLYKRTVENASATLLTSFSGSGQAANGVLMTNGTEFVVPRVSANDVTVTNSDGTTSYGNYFYSNGTTSKYLLDGTAHWNGCMNKAAISTDGHYFAVQCDGAYPNGGDSAANAANFSYIVVLDLIGGKTVYMSEQRLSALGLHNYSGSGAGQLIGFTDSGVSFTANTANDAVALVNYDFASDSLSISTALGDLSKSNDGRTLNTSYSPVNIFGRLNEVVSVYAPVGSDPTQNIYYLLSQ